MTTPMPMPREGLLLSLANPRPPINISIIIPMLNEAAGIQASLAPLQPLRAHGGDGRVEVIVVDGGSVDQSVALATRWWMR